MEEKSLFNKDILEKIRKTRKIFLKFAVGILIAELVFGAVLILTEFWDLAIGRIQGTFLIIALILFLGINSFICLEKGNKTIQTFALIEFISSLVLGVFAFLLMWGIVPANWTEVIMKISSHNSRSYTITVSHMTFWMIAMLVASCATAAGFCIANIMSIKTTTKVVKPLKITAIICTFYLWIFGTIITITQPEFSGVEKLYRLARLAGLALVITALAALVISKANKKKQEDGAHIINGNNLSQNMPKTEAEIRAEIEEKIRREMIEKEIRAKLEAEQIDNIKPTNEPLK